MNVWPDFINGLLLVSDTSPYCSYSWGTWCMAPGFANLSLVNSPTNPTCNHQTDTAYNYFKNGQCAIYFGRRQLPNGYLYLSIFFKNGCARANSHKLHGKEKESISHTTHFCHISCSWSPWIWWARFGISRAVLRQLWSLLLPTSLFLSWCFYWMNFNQKRSEQKWEGRYEVCTLVFGICWAFCFPLISINIRLGIMRWEEGCFSHGERSQPAMGRSGKRALVCFCSEPSDGSACVGLVRSSEKEECIETRL